MAVASKKRLLAWNGYIYNPRGLRVHKHSKGWPKYVEQISFRQCVTFCEHRQLKGPHFHPTVAKGSISTTVHWQSHSTTESTITTLWQILEAITPWPDPLPLCIRQAFSAAATKGWAWCNHNVMQSWRNVLPSRELKLLVGIGCWEFPKGMAGMDLELLIGNNFRWNLETATLPDHRRISILDYTSSAEKTTVVKIHSLK